MTKQLLKPALFWLMTLALLWSCQEPLESPLALETDLTLQEAQSFYEQLQANSLEADRNSKAVKRSKKTSRQAFWDKQEKYKLGNQELITIPVLFDDDLNTPGYGFKKMVFYKDTKTNKTNARIIEYIFDKDYLVKNFGNLSMKTFTGIVIIYDAEGNFLEGMGIKDGKQTRRVGVALDGEIMKAQNANGRESATTGLCMEYFNASGCTSGAGAIGGASNQSGTTEDLVAKAIANCTMVHIYFLSGCESSGGGSLGGVPLPNPLPIGGSYDIAGAFAGGGGGGSGGSGGTAYVGPNTGASVTQNVGATLPSDVNPQEYFQALAALGISSLDDLPGTPIFVLKGAYATIKEKVSLTMALIRYKYRNTSVSDERIFVDAYKALVSNPLHLTLDIAGLVEGLGAIPDAINGGIYLLEGDKDNAAISFVSATPIVGTAATTAKYLAASKFLVRLSDGYLISKQGLKLGIDYLRRGEDNRLLHVMKHIEDAPNRDSAHGVFNNLSEWGDVIAKLDEAWLIAKTNNIPKQIGANGNWGYVIPMPNVGYQGGNPLLAGHGQTLNQMVLIFKANTTEIVTAYPVPVGYIMN